MKYIRTFCSVTILLLSISSYALENSQAQDVRLNKAKILINQQRAPEAFKLLMQNLKGPFHLDTIHYLVDYNFDRKLYIKSFRYLKLLAKRSIPKEIQELHFNSKKPESFIKTVEELPKLKAHDYSILEYVARKLYELYFKKSITPELLPYMLNLSEKYYLICYAHQFRIVDTSYSLAQIALTKKDYSKAISYILTGYGELKDTPNIEHKVSSSELQVSLAETLIKDGMAHTGALIMRSAALDQHITPELKEYIATYSKTIEKSYVNVVYDYQLKMKNNILQTDKVTTQQKSALNNHNHLNIFYQNHLNQTYSLVSGIDVINETALSKDVKQANFTSISADLQLKEYEAGNALSSFNLRIDSLSGRDLPSLYNIQERMVQTLSYSKLWLNPIGKWELILPLSLKQYRDRKSTAFAAGLNFESYESSRWFRLHYQGLVGVQLEGNALGSTKFADLNITNDSKISPTLDLFSIATLHKQINPNQFLDYRQLTLEMNLSYKSLHWDSLSLTTGFHFKERTFANNSFQMLDFSLGGKYSF